MAGSKLTALMAAAETYGDAKAAQDRAINARVRAAEITPIHAAAREAAGAMESAARAYATSTRKRRAALAAQQKGEDQ